MYIVQVQVSEKEYKKKNGKSIHKKVEASVGVPRYKYPKVDFTIMYYLRKKLIYLVKLW